MNKQAKSNRKRNVIAAEIKEKQNRRKASHTLIVLGVLILVTFSVGALANWRSLPIFSNAVPTGTPPLMPADAPSREYVYAGSALISTVEAFREAPNDLAVWRPSSGTWYILNSAQQMVTQPWGLTTDSPAPGDFDGDGKTDFCVFRPSNGTWYIINSSNGGNQYITHGANGDIPAVGDYDGDGKSDVAYWRPANQTWNIRQSSNGVIISPVFGTSGDKPVPADFDGDGKADLAVWRNGTATFWVSQSSNNQWTNYSIGLSGDEPVVADYDGDGKTDYATRRGSDNIWRIRRSSDNTIENITWGLSADIAVPGRYNDSGDTDSKADIAVYRGSNRLGGIWYIRRSSDGSMRAQQNISE